MVKLREEVVNDVNVKMVKLKRELDLLELSLNHFGLLYGKGSFLLKCNVRFVNEPDIRVFKNDMSISIEGLEEKLVDIKKNIIRVKDILMNM